MFFFFLLYFNQYIFKKNEKTSFLFKSLSPLSNVLTRSLIRYVKFYIAVGVELLKKPYINIIMINENISRFLILPFTDDTKFSYFYSNVLFYTNSPFNNDIN